MASLPVESAAGQQRDFAFVCVSPIIAAQSRSVIHPTATRAACPLAQRSTHTSRTSAARTFQMTSRGVRSYQLASLCAGDGRAVCARLWAAVWRLPEDTRRSALQHPSATLQNQTESASATQIADATAPTSVGVVPPTRLVPPEELADADSQFEPINGVRIHYKERVPPGADPTTALVLLHGFAASVFSWEPVLDGLATATGMRVVAFDRPAFGLTERPRRWAAGANPYTFQFASDATIALMDVLGIKRGVLIGHSAGGALAAYTALEHPDRVSGLVLEAAAVAKPPPPDTPEPKPTLQQRLNGLIFRIGLAITPLAVRRARSIADNGDERIANAYFDRSRIRPGTFAGYRKPLQVQDWDLALVNLFRASNFRGLRIGERLKQLTIPVLVITGDSDRIVAASTSEWIASEVPDAQLEIIPQCGHLPHEETDKEFVDLVSSFITKHR